MNTKDTGGPAFPCEWDYIKTNREAANGMTLRDYFAAKALSGWLASFGPDGAPRDKKALAEYVYEIADAMLRARNA